MLMTLLLDAIGLAVAAHIALKWLKDLQKEIATRDDCSITGGKDGESR